MSVPHFSYLQLKLELLTKLSVAQNQKTEGVTGRILKLVMTNISESINGN